MKKKRANQKTDGKIYQDKECSESKKVKKQEKQKQKVKKRRKIRQRINQEKKRLSKTKR